MKGILRSLLLLFFILTLPFAGLQAYETRSGGFRDLLELGVGARSMGMGNAAVSTVQDASAAFWNPAALALLDSKQTSSSKSFLKLDRQFDFGAAAFPLGKTTIGGYISRFKLDDISVTEQNLDQIVGVGSDGTPIYDVVIKDVYSDSLTVMGLSLGAALFKDLSIGGSLKYLRESVYKEEATGFGADMGFLYTPTSDVRIGATLRNLPAKLEWNGSLGASTPLPVTGTLGISYHYHDSLIMALGIKKTEDVDFAISAGAEYNYSQKLFLRTGYTDDGFTAGFGVRMKDWQVDYAYADRSLYPEHRLSSTFKWGSTRTPCHSYSNPILRELGPSQLQAGRSYKTNEAPPSGSAEQEPEKFTVIERKDKTIDSLFVGGDARPPVRTVVASSEGASLAPRPMEPDSGESDATMDSFERMIRESDEAARIAAEQTQNIEDQKAQINNLFEKTAADYGSLQESDFYFKSRNLMIDGFDATNEKHVPGKDFESRTQCPRVLFTINRARRKVYANSVAIENYRLVESDSNEVLAPLKAIAQEYDVFYIFRPETQQVVFITPSRNMIKANIFSNLIAVNGSYRKMSSQIAIVNGQVLGPVQVIAALIKKNY